MIFLMNIYKQTSITQSVTCQKKETQINSIENPILTNTFKIYSEKVIKERIMIAMVNKLNCNS